MSQEFTNFGVTTLAVGINNVILAGVFTDETVFPTTGNFIIQIEDEYVVVDNIEAGTGNFTMTARGYDGSTAVSHSSGATCKLVLNKAALEDHLNSRIIVGTAANRPTTANNGQRYYADDIDLAWIMNNGNWELFHPAYVPYTGAINLGSWTAVNHGTSVWTEHKGTVNAVLPGQAGVDAIRGFYKTKPSAPFTINGLIRCSQANTQYALAGIGLYDGTKIFGMTLVGYNTAEGVSIDRYNSVTSWASGDYRQIHWSPGYMWLRIEDDNTNWKFSFSLNGKDYVLLKTIARNTHLTPTNVIIFADVTNNLFPTHAFHFLGFWES